MSADDAIDDGLILLGVAPLAPGDGAPEGFASVALYGPDPERFWPVFSAAPEYRDGAPDPLDRWSRRTGAAMAAFHNGVAVFPFGGPPYHPVLSWAIRSGRAWSSPIGFVVHDRLGLWFSVRLALLSPAAAPSPPDAAAPCARCVDRPCLFACPVGALSDAPAYDLAQCAAHLETTEGEAGCMRFGCRARAACPVGRAAAHAPARAAHHMAAFRAARRQERAR